MVKVEIEVPDAIMNFLQAVNALNGLDIEKYLQSVVVSRVLYDIDENDGDPDPFWNPEAIKKKHGLDELEKEEAKLNP